MDGLHGHHHAEHCRGNKPQNTAQAPLTHQQPTHPSHPHPTVIQHRVPQHTAQGTLTLGYQLVR